MLAVAIKPDKLPFLLRMFKTLISPDSPLDLRELLEIFNRHVWFLMDPDNLVIQDLECGVSDFYQEPLVEELFIELWNEVNSQLNILDNSPVKIETIVAISIDTVIVEYDFEVLRNDCIVRPSTNRLDSFLRNVRPANNRRGDQRRGRISSFGCRNRPYARRRPL